VIAATLAGCHMGLLGVVASVDDKGPYAAGTLANALGPSAVRTVGCLDVGLAISDRNESELLDVHVGNRCSVPEALDLARLSIRGTDRAGEVRPVTLQDRRGEIAVLHVGGAESGRERILLEGAHGMEQLCFELGAIAPDAPEARPTPLCFRRRGTEWSPT
jgi:hypothetical protein